MGRATSSNFGKIMANDGKAFGNPAKEYAQKKALERVTQKVDLISGFSNKFMDRGTELEPVAIDLYEKMTFTKVDNGGFYSTENLGDSPDGRVGSGCIEVKSVIPNTQWKRIKSQKFDSTYKWQIQGHLLIGGFEWCDFISYCPEMPEAHRLFIDRVYPDPEMFESLKKRLDLFEAEIQNNINLIS